MDDQNKNLILATVLSGLVLLVWFVLFPPEQTVQDPNAIPTSQSAPAGDTDIALAPPAPADGTSPQAVVETPNAVPTAPRLEIETPKLVGSLSLLGGRIDTLSLKDYRDTLDPESGHVSLLQPVGGNDKPYYALYGWSPAGDLTYEQVPGANTQWSVESGDRLTVETPVTLRWDNGAGLIFRRMISIDQNYMFAVEQSVENTATAAARLAPYGIVARHGEPDLVGFFVLHEGIVGHNGEELNEIDYTDMPDMDLVQREGAPAEVTEAINGWIGFTDKYWMTTLIPAQDQPFSSVAKYVPSADIYQIETRMPVLSVEPGQTATTSSQLFAGAKEWETIRAYQNEGGIHKFLDSIDWGWFFFLTKPIFAVLHWLNGLIGNMGWSIIALTLLIKAVLFPLAYRSYVSMAKMKELQPQMEALKEKAGDDRQKMQQGMMELYKKEKVNPASGCLPILLQIPIFFSLYKVIFVTIELRHAPWVGWIKDLSAPDPSSILNLFGLLPWATPEPGSLFFILSLGILPIILGISMWLQQKLNPAPTDKTQAMIFAWMPWVFMFMLGSFASGLVLYWIANNTITFTQQYIIMRSQGYKPDVFGNISSSFKRKPKSEDN